MSRQLPRRVARRVLPLRVKRFLRRGRGHPAPIPPSLVVPYDEAWERVNDAEPRFPPLASQACTQDQMETATHAAWCEAMRIDNVLHRKNWEFAYIAQALDERGLLTTGTRGLGFAVGTEPLPALFASRGCSIVASDLAPDRGQSDAWIRTGQHAASVTTLNRAGVCPPDVFADRVELRWVDMTAVDPDLVDFDFTWSACAFEHLGSIEAGLHFIRRQMECLRPGGVAVHTTELNVSSDENTVDSGPTVLFRKRDLVGLADELHAAGHTVAPITFRLGDRDGDRHVVLPPYSHDPPHLKIQVGAHVTTSFGLIIQKRRL